MLRSSTMINISQRPKRSRGLPGVSFPEDEIDLIGPGCRVDCPLKVLIAGALVLEDLADMRESRLCRSLLADSSVADDFAPPRIFSTRSFGYTISLSREFPALTSGDSKNTPPFFSMSSSTVGVENLVFRIFCRSFSSSTRCSLLKSSVSSEPLETLDWQIRSRVAQTWLSFVPGYSQNKILMGCIFLCIQPRL